MKGYLKPVFTLAAFALLASGSVQADRQEKMIIALKTDDFEMTETDVSSLAIGEAKTIETGSGQVIDLLRTADGVEIYVDGELLEMNFDSEGLHEDGLHEGQNIVIHKGIELTCTSWEEGTTCSDKMAWVSEGEEIDLEALHEMHMDGEGEGHTVIMIKKQVVIED